eukprot:TRINITY_DN33294_c0_g1_i1.p1 TRINITY_DN33294_c0_g1~~TRINITY_DN33294_c0_g1_i1.p1  ORF type:complete len:600 (+),score=69.30 TRINITY_DN33294_c0_g1_i1:161-1960(+)
MASPPFWRRSSGTTTMTSSQSHGGVVGRCSVRLGSQSPPVTPTQQLSVELPTANRGSGISIDALSMSPCLTSPLATPGGKARATRVGSAPASSAWMGGQVGGSATTAARLDQHESMLRLQQSQIEKLVDEGKVLRDCLVHAGSLAPEAFAVRLHRHRFTSVLGSHPLESDANLARALGARELAVDIATGAGPPGIEALRLASRASAQAMATVEKDLRGVFSECIIVVGGFDGQEETCTAERFDPAVGVWESLPPMGVPRSVLGAAVVAGCLYVCGGQDGPLSAECFDPAADSWAPLAPMASRRWSTGTAVIGGCLYACGGYEWERELDTAERYDPATGKWETLPSMSVCRGGAAVAALRGRLYLCGGTHGGIYVNSVESFNPLVDEWELVAPMSVHRGQAAAATVGENLYVCGGCDGHKRHASVERYDPDDGIWEAMPSLVEGRASPAVAVTGARIYLCGGRDGQKFLSSVERFDPVICAWDTLRPMSAKRSMAATAVLGGKLYVCGGHDGAEFRRSVERFDPERGTWELLPPMRGRRSSASACAIWSPAMTLVVGADSSAVPSSSARGVGGGVVVVEEVEEAPMTGFVSPLSITGTPN